MPFKDESGIMKRIRVVTNQPDPKKEKEIQDKLASQAVKETWGSIQEGFAGNVGKRALDKVGEKIKEMLWPKK